MQFELVWVWMSKSIDKIVQLHLKPVSLSFKQSYTRQDEVFLTTVRDGSRIVQIE